MGWIPNRHKAPIKGGGGVAESEEKREERGSSALSCQNVSNVARVDLLGRGFAAYLCIDCAGVVLVESLEGAPAVPHVRGLHEHGQGAIAFPAEKSKFVL